MEIDDALSVIMGVLSFAGVVAVLVIARRERWPWRAALGHLSIFVVLGAFWVAMIFPTISVVALGVCVFGLAIYAHHVGIQWSAKRNQMREAERWH